MGLTTSDIIIIVFSTILCLLTVILVIQEAEKQMFMFGLRPSESTSSDMAGLVTLSRGLKGSVKLTYGNITRNVLYNITIRDKLVCVTSTARYRITDCSSYAFENVEEPDPLRSATGFGFVIKKNRLGDVNLTLL